MKIRKFFQFINEELNDTPENYVAMALTKLKRDVDRMFDYEVPDENSTEEKTPQQAKRDFKDKSKMSFKDLGLRLESNELSKYSKLYDSLTVKFSDELATYALIIMIDLKEALPKDATKDFKISDIKKCYVKFKKYDINSFDIIGQISKNVEVKKLDEEFIIDLKLELDEEFGSDEEECEIETE